MLYFIPSWYKQNTWNEKEQSWHVRRMHTEFDDTVKQIQLFQRSGAYPYQILLLSFAPNLRHFLHRQGVFRAPYWSCFDAIQEVRRKKVSVFSYHQLNWPAHIEFVYTPYVLVAQIQGIRYAQIEFGEDGNPIQIDMYTQGIINRRNIYDDRGFVSSTILYQEGEAVYQDYLNESGMWKIRHFFADGHVEVNPKTPCYLLQYQGEEQQIAFEKLQYDSLDEVINEVFVAYINKTSEKDIFCAAAHKKHMELLVECLKERKCIFSFFGERYPIADSKSIARIVEASDYLLTDSKVNTKRLLQAYQTKAKESLRFMEITPYDTRMDQGISQQLDVQMILTPVDHLEDVVFESMIRQFVKYLHKNEHARVHLFTRHAREGIVDEILSRVRRILIANGENPAWARRQMPQDALVTENVFDLGEREEDIRFVVEQKVDELSISKCVRQQRIYVDMSKEPDLYLQINCISMGIPQIVRTANQYVEHEKNGKVLKKIVMLPEALAFYLDGLSNWNEAMISSYEIGKQFTTERLLEQWKEVIKAIG